MSAPIRTPRSDWIAEGLLILQTGGPDAVRIDPLAKSLGVTRGGFYWHFANRQAFLDELVDSWEQLVVDEVITSIDQAGGSGRDKLRQLISLATSPQGAKALAVEPAIRDWARRDRHVARRLRRIDKRRVDYMRGLFRDFCASEDEIEARVTLAMAMHISAPLMVAHSGGRSRREVFQLAFEHLLQ